MKDISIYFTPVELGNLKFEADQIGSKIILNQHDFPEVKKNSCAIFSVPEFRGNHIPITNKVNSQFRNNLYSHYFGGEWTFELYDLGEILPGKELADTYYAVSNVVAELVKINIIPIIIGGSQDLIFSVYKGYEKWRTTCALHFRINTIFNRQLAPSFKLINQSIRRTIMRMDFFVIL
jgi:hypothetical protein